MTGPSLSVNLFSPDVVTDPYPLYEEIRSHGNVVFNELMGGWMLVGFDECAEVLTDNGDRFAEVNGDPEIIFWFDAPNIITIDGPEHRRLRGVLSPLFTRSAVAKWERRVQEVVEGLLAPLTAGGSEGFDLIADFTMIPTVIVADMLGVPPERHEDFRRWSHEIVSNLSYGQENPAAKALMKRAAVEVNEYLQSEIERHRELQLDDLLTHMIQRSGAEAMSEAEIRSTAVLLLIAGYDTTAKTMGNTLVALEAHPEQRRWLVDNLERIPDAIEEALRWNGPVQYLARMVQVDTRLGDVELSKGELVFAFVGAANRDPARWDDPLSFDVRRPLKSHLAFGYGPHLCLGAPLARLETKVAMEHLLRLLPDYRLEGIDYGSSLFVRGPESGVIHPGPDRSAA